MPPQKTMISRSPNVSRSSRLPSIVPSIAAAYFWLVVVSKIIDRGRRKPRCIFYIFFIVPFAAPNDWMVCPPALSSPPSSAISSPLTLPLTLGRLLFSNSNDRRPPKANAPPLSLFFDGLRLGSQNKGTNCGAAQPKGARRPWVHRERRSYEGRAW